MAAGVPERAAECGAGGTERSDGVGDRCSILQTKECRVRNPSMPDDSCGGGGPVVR